MSGRHGVMQTSYPKQSDLFLWHHNVDFGGDLGDTPHGGGHRTIFFLRKLDGLGQGFGCQIFATYNASGATRCAPE